MNRKIFLPLLGIWGSVLNGTEIAGTPRDTNTNNTGGYDGTRVQAQLIVQVGPETNTVHFVRDNNDPRVITKTYLLKNVDAYGFRDYLRQMVQSKRVGNATLQQSYPGNTQTVPVMAESGTPELTSANTQPGYAPAVQLGSNTAVECLKYIDGTGLLIVSAEEYRFKDHENGMGIDTLVAMLDDPALGSISYGSQMFIYMPKYVPARNLQPLIETMGMNGQDVTELWQGTDLVAYDPDLNWLVFDVTNYSAYNISEMLEQYDVPVPQVRMKISVYEIYRENDDKIGLDFQAWKNNEGADFFSAGGRYRNNWTAIYSTSADLAKSYGSERTSYYNFNPKWNTRYIDFLASTGKAHLLHTGEICIRNNTPASIRRENCIFYMDVSQDAPKAQTDPDTGVGPYQLLSSVIGEKIAEAVQDLPIGKGHQQHVVPTAASYGFTMTVENVSVNLKETRFDVSLSNSSLIGFESTGAPRISSSTLNSLTVSLPHGTNRFIIGGLHKQETVKSKTGVPFLMDIPILEYIFSSVATSVKHADLVVVGECQAEFSQLAKGK